jgi:uncharacterized protein YabE (DUF348 family)
VVVLLGVIATALYLFTGTPIELQMDQTRLTLRTHQTTVGAALAEANITLSEQDRVEPALDTPIQSGMKIKLERARVVLLIIDGKTRQYATHLTDPTAILTEAGLSVTEPDSFVLRGNTLSVIRATPVTVEDQGSKRVVYTDGNTVSAALASANILLYTADQVTPPLSAPLIGDGLRPVAITINRATPIFIQADGRLIRARTLMTTVGDALNSLGLGVIGADRVDPPQESLVSADLVIRVTRVTEAEEIERSVIPYRRLLTPNPLIPLDQLSVIQPGKAGLQEVHTRVRREDGIEVSRSAPIRWVATPPLDEVAEVGTRIVINRLETTDGTFQYWRLLNVTATSYKPALTTTSPRDPRYGVTVTGQRLVKGIIAVDPTFIPLGTEVYIPGYGTAVAGDTQPNLTGLTVKLGYSDEDYQAFEGVIKVYLITPIPPESKIRPLPIPTEVTP